MNKRLRKKKKVKEFTEYAFYFKGVLNKNCAQKEFIAWTDKFINEIEKAGFKCGGGFDKNSCSLIISVAPIKNHFSNTWKFINTNEFHKNKFINHFKNIFYWKSFGLSGLVDINQINDKNENFIYYKIDYYENLKLEILKKEDLEDKLYLIYNYIDDLLLDGQFEICDNILLNLNHEDFNDPTILLSFLTITAAAKDRLKNRHSCYLKIKSFFEKNYTKDKVEAMLVGLE